MSEAIDAALKPTAIGALRQLLASRGGRFGLALLLGGLGAVTLSQASLTRVESNIVVLQAELVARATLMFDEYEETGSVSIGTFERYEAAIDKIFPALDDYVAIERSEVAALYSDSLRLESD